MIFREFLIIIGEIMKKAVNVFKIGDKYLFEELVVTIKKDLGVYKKKIKDVQITRYNDKTCDGELLFIFKDINWNEASIFYSDFLKLKAHELRADNEFIKHQFKNFDFHDWVNEKDNFYAYFKYDANGEQ